MPSKNVAHYAGFLVRYTLPFVIACPIVVAVHELGHAGAVLVLGGKILHIELSFIPLGGAMLDWQDFPTEWQEGFCFLMGSGLTTAIAWFLVAGLASSRVVRRFGRYLTVLALVLAWDIILYSILPALKVPQTLLGMDSIDAEPVKGALMLGVPQALFYCLLTVQAMLFHLLLVGLMLTQRTKRRMEPA